jgi:dUTP pyrophosphatase
MLVKGGITPSEILTKESLKDLEIGSLEDCLIALEENYPNLDLRELTEVENPDPYSDRIHQSVRLSNVELVQVPSIPPNFEKTLKNEMPSSSDHLKLADGHLTAVHSQKRAKIYYSLCDPEGCHPRCSYSSPGIDLPLQETLVLEPSMRVLCDTKIKFFIPSNFYGQIAPRSSSTKLNITIHNGVIDNDYSGTIKISIKSCHSEKIVLTKGDYLAQLLIIPVIHPNIIPVKSIEMNTERSTGSFGSSEQGNSKNKTNSFEVSLNKIENSFLHEICKDLQPSELEIPGLNMTVLLPSDPEENKKILQGVKQTEYELLLTSRQQKALPKPENFTPKHVNSCLDELTRELMWNHDYLQSRRKELTQELNWEVNNIQSQLSANNVHLMNNNIQNNDERRFKEEAISDMCQRLAVLAVEYIKEQSISKETLARCQLSDDYLNPIYESARNRDNDFPSFHLTKGVLFKRIYDRDLQEYKSVIALPDILLPSVVHSLHTTLGHPSHSTTQKNFEQYYYHPKSRKFIKEYVRSCITCAIAGKIDVRKIESGQKRTMQPTGPRQCAYMDLLPFPKSSSFQYILLSVDAYSQYISTVPLRDKTGPSVLQGVLSIFSSMGLYRQVFFDNETSFTKVAKALVKNLPLEIHYSVPYAHHQNAAETAIKLFKKCFLKVLNDSEHPKQNSDWITILPVVTQAVNRQVVLSLGMTRESLHFNSPTEFYPLAHIAGEAQSDLQDAFNTFDRNFYQKLVDSRLKRQAYLNRGKIPIFFEGQLVTVKNQDPTPGSTILKLPYKGPFRVKQISHRNVTLIDLESGREVTSFYEFLKPLSLKEFRLFLSKGWDLHNNNEKRTRSMGSLPILDIPLGLFGRTSVEEEEARVDNADPENPNDDIEDENSDVDGDANNPDDSDSADSDDSDNSDADTGVDDGNDNANAVVDQDQIPYDDPRFDPQEGPSSSSIFNFEPRLFDERSENAALETQRELNSAWLKNKEIRRFTRSPPLLNPKNIIEPIQESNTGEGDNTTPILESNPAAGNSAQHKAISTHCAEAEPPSPLPNFGCGEVYIGEDPKPPPPLSLKNLNPSKSNLKKTKKVGFKSFFTKFFTPDE